MTDPKLDCLKNSSLNLLYRKNLLSLLFILIILSSSKLFSQTPAFPGAEGFGKYATGGRGGTVLRVTNLNSSGSGSLRAALEASGPRTIVFEVGGTINLNGANIYVNNGNVTVAGQTAPGDGILIRGGMIQFEASNVIVRYIRVRPGPSYGTDGISITAWSGNLVENVILDHCSVSWADDENFDIRAVGSGTVRNITIQNSIISECGYGSLAGPNTYNLTYYRNLYANNSERNIRTNYPETSELHFELINNLIYGFRYSTVPSQGTKFTAVNNKYKKSSQVNILSNGCVDPTNDGTGNVNNTHAYVSGNITATGIPEYSSGLDGLIESSAYNSSGIVPISASELEGELLNDVGCSYPNRDEVDNRIVNQYNTATGGISDNGVYPTILGGTPPTDSDNDGMPDYWEIENGLNINDPSDRNIVQANGYTNLEHYINFLGLGQSQVNAGEDQTVCEGQSIVLTATGANTYLWSTGETTPSITVSPSTTTTYTVTGTDAEGGTSEDSVTVNVEETPIADAGEDVSMCADGEVTLTASGGDSYLWSNGEATQSITVTPSEDTTYTVTVSNNNCQDTDSVTVTVLPAPDAYAGEDATILEGESTVLTASGGDNFLWSTGETTASITVTPSQTTTYFVTVTSGTCERTVSVTVFVEEPVTANAGEDQTICEGEGATLTASGGTNYLWSTGETTQTISVNPMVTTTYTVTVSDEFSSDTDEVTVNVNEVPIAYAGEDQSINIGELVTLTASGGDTYLWSTGATTQSIDVSPTESTTYIVTVFTNGCEDFDDVEVIVNDVNANAGEDVNICEGETVTLTALGGDFYLWNTGETTASIEVSPIITTTYSVEVSDGFSFDTDEVTVFVDSAPTAFAGEDETICEGESITLSASGGETFLWSTGETTASIEVSPTQTTEYTVTAFNGGCEDSDSVTVQVNPIPIANAGNDVDITEGESTTLSATGGDSYEWSTGETTQSIEVSPLTDTIYSVIVSQNGCEDIDEVTVFVYEAVEANAGQDVTICQGFETTLTATGGDSYLWNTGETTQSITVSPMATSTYTVIVSNEFSSDTDEVTVTVNPLPNVQVTGDVTILQGEFVTLSATGANSYIWNNGATEPNIAVSPNETTTYSVTGFINDCSDTEDVVVSVLDPVEANAGQDETICLGSSITLTASGGENYLWNTGETTESITVSPEVNTTYTVIVSNELDSDADEVTILVEDCEIELPNEEPVYEFSLYNERGNPSMIMVRLSGLEGDSMLYIHDIAGNLVYSQPVQDNEGNQQEIPLNTSIYSQGVYVITLQEQNKSTPKQVLFR